VSRYTGLIKVVGPDMMCFPVRPGDLEPLGTATYDPYALCDPEPGVQVMDVGEWNRLHNEMFIAAHKGCGHD
jgi:hypothetical protein